ncbi:MAG: hypothetical protein QM493_09705 [Sulfurovum sp.]
MIENLCKIISSHQNEIDFQLADDLHPHFQAHFPDYPLLAGFALIDIIGQILEDEIIILKSSKFIAPIFPNDMIHCDINTQEKQRSIKVFKSNKKVSEIRYEYL